MGGREGGRGASVYGGCFHTRSVPVASVVRAPASPTASRPGVPVPRLAPPRSPACLGGWGEGGGVQCT